MNIINSSVSMQSKPSEESDLETECLFGEKVEILKEHLDWAYCRLYTDNYYGWVKKSGLGILKKPTHRVITNRTMLFTHKDPKSNFLFYLPLGAKVSVKKITSKWAEISLSNCEIQIGFVPKRHIVCLNNKVKDWVKIAEQLVGTPYKWGGRDSIGIDCSALLQLSYQTYGENIPRNTSQQIKLRKKQVSDSINLKRGCVVFWKGHVGIMVDKFNCIHANAFHMETKIEPLKEIMDRSDYIIKMMDFN